MEDFKGNPKINNNPAGTPLDEQRPTLDPITQRVTVKKESELKKFKQQFFSEDAKSVKGHIFTQVIVPGIQKLISDMVKNGIDWLIYGIRGISSKSGSDKVSYSNYYDRTRPSSTPVIPNSAYNKPNIFNVSEAVFSDRGESEEVLARLREEIDRYGMVSVADFYDLIKQPHSYTDCKYGWRELRDAEVERVRDGYSIRFPKIIPLE